MSRVLLVDPNYGVWKAGAICRHSQFEPLGLEYLAAQAKRAGHCVDVIQQRELPEEELLQDVLTFRPDIVGFSTMTCTFDAAKRISNKLKACSPRTVTVFGGYHATAIPEICLDESIDYVIQGEADESFLELIKTLECEGDVSKVKGVAFAKNGVMSKSTHERISDPNKLAFPLRKKEALQECRIESLSWPLPSEQRCVAQVLFSRGCPFNCTFCCSPSLWGSNVKFRSPENLIDELRQLKNEFGTNYVFFADLTFNVNRRKSLDLCAALIKSKLGMNWYAMCRPDNVDQELISCIEIAGCTKIAYGIDGLTDTTLKRIKPQQNLTMDAIRRTLSITQVSRIITRAFIIIGYPWETRDDLINAKTFVKSLPVDDLRIAVLTPLPGSALYEEFKSKGLLLHENFARYTSEECVTTLEGISPDELCRIREEMFREFYESREYTERMKEKVRRYPFLKQSYEEFFDLLYSKGALGEYALESSSIVQH